MNKLVPYEYVSDRVAVPMEPSSTYGLALDALRSRALADKNAVHPRFVKPNGSEVYRPLTFKETIEAQVNDFYTEYDPANGKRSADERLQLFKEFFDTCTAVAYKRNSTFFKIIPISKQLITLKKDFSTQSTNIYYDSIKADVLDSSKGQYNKSVSKDVSVDLWLPLLDGDRTLSQAHADIVYAHFSNGRGFYVNQNTAKDELRAVFARILYVVSDANAWDSLYSNARFLLVAPRKKFQAQPR